MSDRLSRFAVSQRLVRVKQKDRGNIRLDRFPCR